MPVMGLARRFSKAMRAKRFEMFEALVAPLPRPLKILDVGGTNAFWKEYGWADDPQIQITLSNIFEQEQVHPNITPHVGDATKMPEFEDGSFDLVFTNSVIEHLFTFEQQAAMAV